MFWPILSVLQIEFWSLCAVNPPKYERFSAVSVPYESLGPAETLSFHQRIVRPTILFSFTKSRYMKKKNTRKQKNSKSIFRLSIFLIVFYFSRNHTYMFFVNVNSLIRKYGTWMYGKNSTVRYSFKSHGIYIIKFSRGINEKWLYFV